MTDFSKALTKFHDEHVTLTNDLQADMRNRRDTNRKRIIDGLEALGKPAPVDWINQGGYAQHTMTQPPEGDEDSRYDIDMGVVFDETDAKTAQTTKGWVRDAIAEKASAMKNEPECKPKCVRVVYADGYQCDFPVFQAVQNGGSHQLAAGTEWIESDPKSMNDWVNGQVSALSPEGSGVAQLRQIIRFVKYYCKVKSFENKRKFPSGLVATAIAIECYTPSPGRLDEAFRETLRNISYRSKHQLVLANGVVISDAKDVDRLQRLIECAANSISELDALDFDAEHDEVSKAWKKIFRHSYFDTTATSKSSARKTASSVLAGLGLSNATQAARAESSVAETLSRSIPTKPWSGHKGSVS